MRYNGGSLSKSAFPTSTKRNEKRGNLLRSLIRASNILQDSSVNNLRNNDEKILKTEQAIELKIDC